MFEKVEKDGLVYFKISEFENQGITAAFSTRRGGYSSGKYSGLNLGLQTGDNRETVLKNRRLFARNFNIDPRHLTAAEQVHGDRVYRVKPGDRGKGALTGAKAIAGVDALITGAGIPLISFYADCVPLFLADPVQKAVGMAHAGWRGTSQKIGVKTLIKLEKIFKSNPKDCLVALGPSIRQQNYEVDKRVIKVFKANFDNWQEFVTEKGGGKYNLSLQQANKRALTEYGLPPENIIECRLDTFTEEELFYSYRRADSDTGRMAGLIYIKDLGNQS